MTKLELTQEWDKVFPLSEKVNHRKVTFETQYGLTLAADLYTPKDATSKLAAIAVSGPFGAVKEQSSGLYAMRMAERGFVALAFDPSYTGESSGEPRRTASPDINTEDFMAAVDYLSKLENVDPERIGIIGICGWGGIALNAAAADTRIKATVASTMYDMSRISGNGYFDSEDKEESRHAAREAMGKQRLADPMAMAGGVIDPLPEEVPQFVKDYYAYYKTPRGYHARSGNSNDGWYTVRKPTAATSARPPTTTWWRAKPRATTSLANPIPIPRTSSCSSYPVPPIVTYMMVERKTTFLGIRWRSFSTRTY